MGRRKKMEIKQLLTTTIILLLIACSVEYNNGFNASDKEYMQKFLTHIKKSGIAFQEDQDGMLRYNAKDENTVSDIHKLIKLKQSNKTSVQYDEPDAGQYFKSILDKNDIQYIEEIKDGSFWITWYPDNENQKKEIQIQVVQYMFEFKAGTK